MVDAIRPKNLEEALAIINKERCIIFSGGTDLMVRRRRWSGIEPDFDKKVVFISQIKELLDIKKQVKENSEYLIIGGACTCTQIEENSLVPNYIKKVFQDMASPAIRNIATIGGNICNSSPAGDSLPLLYALEAELILSSADGDRKISIEDFILSPGKNIKKENEILKQIKIPLKDYKIKYYKKVGTRKSIALSKVSFVALALYEDEKLYDVRITLGSVAPRIVKNKSIENKIVNQVNDNKLD
ncbi:MAG: xanthine dehydrogenase family protein subunit M, partial [Clostridiaceae bacterium]